MIRRRSEHVTGYFKLHPDFVKIVRAAPYPPLARKGGRLTIDTPDDLAFIEAVHARMAAQAPAKPRWPICCCCWNASRNCARINAHVNQKPIGLASSGGLALIRCDGGGKFGYGHVKRMVALARALRDREGIGAVFALNGSEDAADPDPPRRFRGRDAATATPIWQRWWTPTSPTCCCWMAAKGPRAPNWKSSSAASPSPR